MTVTYLSRSPGTGHSIETLFDIVQKEVGQCPSMTVSRVQLPHISRSLDSVWKNIRFIFRQPFKGIIHVTGDVHYAVLALPKRRTVLTIHDCITLETKAGNSLRYRFFWWFWFYLPVRRAAAVTVISEKTRQELIGYLGQVAEKAIVIPNTYDLTFTYKARRFCKDKPVLLQIGTAPHKNLSRLIDALETISCQLIIVGPLPDPITKELSARQIRYENYVDLSREAIIRLYIECDIVTFVSTYEGFGMPILEANAVGRAVITSDLTPMREVAGEAALLVDPTDTVAIRRAIRRLIDDDTYREKLVQNGLLNAGRFAPGRIADQYLTIYEQLRQ